MEAVFCEGGVVLRGGGVAPSEFIGSVEVRGGKFVGPLLESSGLVTSIATKLLEVPDTRCAAIAMVVAPTLIARGAAVV